MTDADLIEPVDMISAMAPSDAPRKRSRAPPGPAPTLGQLHEAGPKWLWLYCQAPGSYHRAPAAIAPSVAPTYRQFDDDPN